MLLESEQLMHSFTWCDMADLGSRNAGDGGAAAVDGAGITRTLLTASDDGKVNQVDLREGKLRGAIIELYDQVKISQSNMPTNALGKRLSGPAPLPPPSRPSPAPLPPPSHP